MNTFSRTITGVVAMVLGIVVIAYGVFSELLILIYGVVILVIGLLVFFNKKEDDIEEIKIKKKIS